MPSSLGRCCGVVAVTLLLILGLSACGGGGGGDTETASRPADTWNDMKWNEGTWQ